MIVAISVCNPVVWASTCVFYDVPLCQRLSREQAIFVGSVVEKLARGYRVLVAESFKGLPPGTREVTLFPSVYGAFEVGQRYLFNTSGPFGNAQTSNEIHLSSNCTTRRIEESAEDLRFIREYVANPQPARLSIEVVRQSHWGSSKYPPIPGVKLNIRAGKLDWTLTTDATGKVELNPTLPGIYSVAADLPGHRAIRDDSFVPRLPQETVPPHGCGVMRIGMHTDARISGYVLKHDGTPAAGIAVSYAFADPKYRRSHLDNSSATTDRDGWFHLEGAPAGDVVVGVNLTHPPTAKQPYLSVLRTLMLKPNDNRTDIVLHLPPPLKERYVTVRPLWADGSISIGADVSAQVNGVEAESVRSGPNGLTLRLLEGIVYTISARNERGSPSVWMESKTVKLPSTGHRVLDLTINKFPKAR